MAQYPGGTPAFTTKANGDTIQAAHVNDLQAEITAIGGALLTGLAHLLIPDASGARDLGSTAKKWRDLHISGALNAASMALTGSATIGGNATVTGTVTAAQFVGGGAGLTGIPPGTFAMEDLTDVDLTAPANGEVLTYNTGLGQWENAAPGAATGVPTGVIAMWGAAAAPSGWILCQGQAINRTTFAPLFGVIGTTYGPGDGATTFNVPDMQQRFPLGKAAAGTGSALGATGGTIDHTHTVDAHTHGFGTLAVASHSHDAGTFTIAAHTHGAGTYAVASHTHAAGTLANNTVADHDHFVDAHSHGAGTLAVGTSGNNSASDVVDANNDGFTIDVAKHTHTHAAGSVSGSTANSSGTVRTDDNGGHTHTISGSTASASPGLSGSSGSASPGLSGNSGSVAPAISGSTASAAPATDSNNPPFQVVHFIIKD